MDDYSSRKNSDQSYGQLGLNKTVKQVNEKNSLDDFLGENKKKNDDKDKVLQKKENNDLGEIQSSIQDNYEEHYRETEENRRKIDLLERKIFELNKNIEKIQTIDPNGIFQIRTMLQGLGLKGSLISNIMKKSSFELSPENLKDEDKVLEIALREINDSIYVDLPLFSKLDNESSVITILLSEDSVGQTSTAYKLGAIKENSILIQSSQDSGRYKLSDKMFNTVKKEVGSLSEMALECRNAFEKGFNIFIDYKESSTHKGQDEVRKFISGLKRLFENIEIFTCLSSISSETYNRKCLSRYADLIDGVILTKLDMCLNFCDLINLHIDFNNIPLKFFTTGQTIPDDIETATKERLLNGMFKFDRG